MTLDPYAAGSVGNLFGLNVIENRNINGILLVGNMLVAGTVPDEPPIYEQICRDLGLNPLPPSKQRRPAFTPNAVLIKEKL